MQINLKIFCDFDGTITLRDLGDEIFKQFGKFEPYHTQLVNSEINIRQYWYNIVPTLEKTTESDIENFASLEQLDSYFIEFNNMCLRHNYDLYIVSDGFASYIKPIINNNNIRVNGVFCNYINFNSEIPYPEFYGASESCNCLSSSCKRNVVLNHSSEDDIKIYIGDGYSDFCAAEHSDIIFAKKNLAKYCSKNKIPFYNFKSFFDILKIFDNLHSGKIKFKKRRQAELMAQNAYEEE